MKMILAALAVAIMPTVAVAQPAAAPSPITDAPTVATPVPKPQVRRTAARKPASPNIARVAAANRAATQEPQV